MNAERQALLAQIDDLFAQVNAMRLNASPQLAVLLTRTMNILLDGRLIIAGPAPKLVNTADGGVVLSTVPAAHDVDDNHREARR